VRGGAGDEGTDMAGIGMAGVGDEKQMYGPGERGKEMVDRRRVIVWNRWLVRST
jgi:hypothetical protein